MNKDSVKLAIAPIAWTNDDLPDLGAENTFEQCVSEMALSGFTGSEVGNKYPKDPTVLKPALDIRGLQICNQWFSSYLTTQPYEEVEAAFIQQLNFLDAMGAKIIGPAEQGHSVQGLLDTPVLSGKPHFTEKEWNAFTTGLNKLGAIAASRGFKLCYHHHMGTGCQTMAEVDRMLAETDPDKVWLLFDSGHFTFSGENAVEALDKYISRVGHVHLKDIRANIFETVKEKDMSFLDAVRAGVFTVPGDGCIDFPALFKILDNANYSGWIVVEAEQDPKKANPFTYAVMARDYIRKHTGL